MTDPITQCHRVKAKIYSGDEGTSHYYCPVCKDSVNFDGSNPKMTEDADRVLDEILDKYARDILAEVAFKLEQAVMVEPTDASAEARTAILDNYISKEKVNKMIGKDEDGIVPFIREHDQGITVEDLESFTKVVRNAQRAILRKDLGL